MRCYERQRSKKMLHSSQDARNAGANPGAQGEELPQDDKIYAALDLGTNNCRLLIASPHRGGDGASSIRVFDSFSRVVRLGEGVSATGVLSDDAMERTIAALKACQKKLSKYRVTNARFVATEACRRASNGQSFLNNVRDEVGIDIDIISSEEEARLAFRGCSSLLTETAKRAIVFDIGGGSTELMWIDVDRVRSGDDTVHPISDWLSIGFGVMNLADKFGGSDFADMAFTDMVDFLIGQMKPFDDSNGITDIIGDTPVQLLSTSGTVTTLAAIHLDLPRYDRSRIDGITLDISDIRATVQKLLAMRPSGRFNHPCIGPDRADFILSGCAIFEAISTLWPTMQITIADRGVREGIILSLMNRA
jgi:exopolyphosphatase/guanosine-5'-triphosphate,3'-diphosphate pyrophosphatase